MKPNTQKLFRDFIFNRLSRHKNLGKTARWIEENPEVLGVIFSELDCAISSFSRYRNGESGKRGDTLCINAQLFRTVLPENITLSLSEAMIDELTLGEKVLREMEKFEFLETMHDPRQLLPAFIVGLYRTYMLTKFDFLRENNVQVASTIEEMVAVSALSKFSTHIFQATKHWIKDYKKEGFARELALRIRNL